MATTTELTANREDLLEELKRKLQCEFDLARWSHWLNIIAMFLTLVTTGVAVGYGMIPNHSSQITAAPALCAGGMT